MIYYIQKTVSVLLLVGFITINLPAQKDLLVLSRRQQAIIYANFQDKESSEPVIIDNLLEGISESLYSPIDLIVDQSKNTIYIADPFRKQVEKYNLDTEEFLTIDSSFAASPIDLEYHGAANELMWIDGVTSIIYKGELEAKDKNEVVSNLTSNVCGFTHSEETNQTYWTDYYNGKILTKSESESEVQTLFDDKTARPIRLLLSNDLSSLYWTDNEHRIGKIDLKSGKNEYIYEGREDNHPFSLIIDEVEKKIYWSDYGDETVKYSDLDGKNMKVLLEKVREPVALAFAPPIVELRSNEDQAHSETDLFVLSPNPSQGTFTLKYLGEDTDRKNVTIYNSKGQAVHKISNFRRSKTINLEHLANGNYTAIIGTGKEAHIKKLVIVK